MLTRYRRTIGSRNMLQKSGIPPGYVFYADLPNYNSQAYGTLTNGSGVATGSPFTLAIGNNNVDVTTQGTFTVYVRGSGTATSDVATVSGSPQSLTEGNNTVTVTGTGNIIIALANTFFERSPNHLLLTATGAPTYGSQGRTLALNKYLVSTATALNFTSGDFSAWAWVKSTDLTANNYILNRGLLNTDGWGFFITSAGALTFRTDQAATSQTSF